MTRPRNQRRFGFGGVFDAEATRSRDRPSLLPADAIPVSGPQSLQSGKSKEVSANRTRYPVRLLSATGRGDVNFRDVHEVYVEDIFTGDEFPSQNIADSTQMRYSHSCKPNDIRKGFMLIGYGRVSSSDQNLEIQRTALMAAGVQQDHLFEEKASAKTAADRPQLQRCLQFVRSGDTILVTRLDRFARSARDLHNLLATLDEKQVGFRCLEQSMVDTTSASATSRLVVSVIAACSEFESALRAERQAEGIAAAKARGTYKARQSQIDLDEVRRHAARGLKPGEIAPIMKISRASVYRALATIKSASEPPPPE